MRNLCFFYTAGDIWDLALPLFNRVHILWRFFSLSSSLSAGFHKVVDECFGSALPIFCEKKLPNVESVAVSVNNDLENMHHIEHHNSSAFVNAVEEKKNTARIPSTETMDAEASQIKILDDSKLILIQDGLGN